jgi:hypothetical protein
LAAKVKRCRQKQSAYRCEDSLLGCARFGCRYPDYDQHKKERDEREKKKPNRAGHCDDSTAVR